MSNRPHSIVSGEHYHCYNRGVEKRNIFEDQSDYAYFLKSMLFYNNVKSYGELRLYKNKQADQKLVTVLSHSLLPNHYHLLLRSEVDGGVSTYMKKLSGGYTMYFNKKYERSGGLFQGTYKSKHITSDQDLKNVLAYVHLNNIVHDISDQELYRSNLNTQDNLVGGLTSDFGYEEQVKAVRIIKELREGFD